MNLPKISSLSIARLRNFPLLRIFFCNLTYVNKIQKTLPIMHKIVLCTSSLIFFDVMHYHVRLGTGRVNSNWFTMVVSLNEIMSLLACRVQVVERGRKIDEEKRNEGRILPSFFSLFFLSQDLTRGSPPSGRRALTLRTDIL